MLATTALAQSLTGQTSVVDGDTLEFHGQRIRLSRIDAPESDQLRRGDDSLLIRTRSRDDSPVASA
jgi:endonuclease YncB( thermonuclease family)